VIKIVDFMTKRKTKWAFFSCLDGKHIELVKC